MTVLGAWGAGAGKVVHVRKELGSKKKSTDEDTRILFSDYCRYEITSYNR